MQQISFITCYTGVLSRVFQISNRASRVRISFLEKQFSVGTTKTKNVVCTDSAHVGDTISEKVGK